MPKTKFNTYWDDDIEESEIVEYLHAEEWHHHRDRVLRYNELNSSLKHHARITKDSLKLAKRVESEFGIKYFPVAYRVYASEKSAGTWNWRMDGLIAASLGSNEPIKRILKNEEISILKTAFGDYEVFGNDFPIK